MAKKIIDTKRSKDSLTININETVSVQQIDAIYLKLKSLKYDRNNIIFQLAEDNEPDLAFLQILISLKNSKLTENQKITLKAPLDATKKSVILDSIKEIQLATI